MKEGERDSQHGGAAIGQGGRPATISGDDGARRGWQWLVGVLAEGIGLPQGLVELAGGRGTTIALHGLRAERQGGVRAWEGSQVLMAMVMA